MLVELNISFYNIFKAYVTPAFYTNKLLECVVYIFQHSNIPIQCKFIYEEVEKEMIRVVAAIRAQLAPVTQLLLKLWALRGKSSSLLDTCSRVEQLLQQAVQERSRLLMALSTTVSSESSVKQVCETSVRVELVYKSSIIFSWYTFFH